MEKLFGIPVSQLTVALVIIFGVVMLAGALTAVRNPVLLRIALRNIPRRRGQSALIVLGLMLATLLFSASFATGDTLSHSMRVVALDQIGQVDVMVQADAREATGRRAYFDQSYFDQVREQLAIDREVEGVAPLLSEVAPVASAGGRSVPQVSILGFAGEWMSGFDRLEDQQGNTLLLDVLGVQQVYISSDLATELDVQTHDVVSLFLGADPAVVSVAGIYERGANPAGKLSVAMPLSAMQSLTGTQETINRIIITHRGDAIAGAAHSGVTLSRLEPLLGGTGLEAVAVKQNALDRADESGSSFASMFLMFGQFSVAAGILLIFLIFVMLAAARKPELGIARAVGTERGQVVQMFAFEGAVYALIASALGAFLGMGVGMGMVRIIAVAFGQTDLELSFAFRWQSLVMAYALGVVLTFAVVLVSSWFVSRLNIVRAIRDIPEPRIQRTSRKSLVLLVLLPVVGALMAVNGFQSAQLSLFMLGTSLVIIGAALLARRLGVQERAAFTLAGLGLLAWWLIPASFWLTYLPDMEQGIEMFFISGIVLVIGAVWVVIHNSDWLLKAVLRVLGPVRGLVPVLRIAVAYPMQNRFRTGMTLAMFSLVVFTLVVMAFILTGVAAVFGDTEALSGGFHIRGQTGYSNPVADIRTALHGQDDPRIDDFAAIGTINGSSMQVKQEGSGRDPVNLFIQGIDEGYSDSVNYGFHFRAEPYQTDRQVWQTLQSNPGTVVVSGTMVPAKANYAFGGGVPALMLEGLWWEDEALPEMHILVRDARTGNETRLRVIGVLEQTAVFSGQGLTTSQSTVNALAGMELPPQAFMFRLVDGADVAGTAAALEARFLENGLRTHIMADDIREFTGTSMMLNNLLQGFMGLGLVVGIAALGVVAARSVVERRQQIGTLRALGFEQGMVRTAFLLESSFIALVGIATGIALGMGLSVQIIDTMRDMFPGLSYAVPWTNIIAVTLIAYGASLLTTYLPARQASNVYPAEALRYE